jgi:hypothetical protein
VIYKGFSMNRRDQQLLKKQFRWLSPSPPNPGVMALVTAGVFVSGIFFGGSLFGAERAPTQIVSNEAMAANFLSNETPLFALQTQLPK